jgi:hypothetical protein
MFPMSMNSGSASADPAGLTLRQAGALDLAGINALIGQAVMTWSLPGRVKRLALPSYRNKIHS